MKNIAVAVLVAGLSQAAPVYAQTRGGLEVGLSAADYSYREKLDDVTIVKDDGGMAGIELSYVETLDRGWFLRVKLDALTGHIDYRDDAGDTLIDVPQTAGSIELHVGKDLSFEKGGVTLFTGLGLRTLDDESGGRTSASGSPGYDRSIVYHYIPVGIASRISLRGDTGVIVTAQYNFLTGGYVDSRLSTIDPALPNVKLGFNGGNGLRASAMLDVPLGSKRLRMGPYVEHWRLDRSKSRIIEEDGETVELFEPKNRTTAIGLAAILSF